MIRDDLNRGVNKEYSLIELIRTNCNVLSVDKNSDEYDIDLIVELENGKQVLLEIEETSLKNWPENIIKPQTPSLLFTMPIRKIKYFINKGELISEYLKNNSTINSINEFNSLYPIDTKFELNENRVRLYIKGSYNLKKLCIVKSRVILKSLNYELTDQKVIDSRISEIRKWNQSWIFQKNIWENKIVRNYNNTLRDDPVLLILGHIDQQNDLIWINDKEICDVVLKKII